MFNNLAAIEIFIAERVIFMWVGERINNLYILYKLSGVVNRLVICLLIFKFLNLLIALSELCIHLRIYICYNYPF